MFKKSIRFRITFIFIAITAVLILTLFLISRFFLSSFYMNEKVKTLENSYISLNEMMANATEDGVDFSEIISNNQPTEDSDADTLMRTYTDRSNIDVVIVDKENNKSIGFSREKDWLISKLLAYDEFSGVFESGQIPDSKYRQIKKTEQYVIQMIFDPRSGSNNLECWGTLKDSGYLFIMVMPVQSIMESVKIMEGFIVIIGLILLVIGSVIIFLATEYLTKPINQLAAISQKMSGLDFSEKYEGNREDEIGVLGESMNKMSDVLKTTIDDLKETNLKLQQANEKLQEDIDLKEKIDEMRKDFISSVSHELKTPIALIEGYAEGLTEGIAEDPESRDYYCHVIMDEAGKMNKMVKQLTSLSQYEFGEANLTMEEFDLSELVRNVLEKETLVLEEKQAKLRCEIPEECRVIADEFKIEEVFTNYLTNALNHLGGDRNIIVTITKQDAGTVRLGVYNDGENIPEESLERLWEKFYKVDKARTRAYGGSGIGLSIVKAIALAHGQKYGVLNKEKGVEFYITLDGVG